MSTRFWLCSAGILGSSAVLGLGLGHFVTNAPQRGAAGISSAIEGPQASEDGGSFAPSADAGPGRVVCRGCGPTLAERRMASDMAGLDADGMIDGTADPVVRDYLRDAPSPQLRDIPPSPVHRLPLNVQRFADGPAEASPPPVVATRMPSSSVEPVGAAAPLMQAPAADP